MQSTVWAGEGAEARAVATLRSVPGDLGVADPALAARSLAWVEEFACYDDQYSKSCFGTWDPAGDVISVGGAPMGRVEPDPFSADRRVILASDQQRLGMSEGPLAFAAAAAALAAGLVAPPPPVAVPSATERLATAAGISGVASFQWLRAGWAKRSGKLRVGDRVHVVAIHDLGLGRIEEISEAFQRGGGTRLYPAYLIGFDAGTSGWFNGVSLTRISE